MITVQMLEHNDIIHPDDWCRPLELQRLDSGEVPETSCYSGQPINNLRWIKVRDILGVYWHGKTVREVCRKLIPYEFIRANNIPIQSKHDY